MAKAEEALSEKAFAIWLTRNPQGLTGLAVAILYVLIVVARDFSEMSSVSRILPDFERHRDFYNSSPSLIQSIALLPPLWWCIRVLPPQWPGDDVATKACLQLARSLAALIAVWIIFYLLNFLDLNRWTGGFSLEPWIDFFNNMQAVFLFACYWTLTAITVPDSGSSPKNKVKALGLPLIFSYSLWVVLVFHLADLAAHSANARFWFQLLSGLAVGICMALMVGCLESEYLDSPRALTAFLYSYSVLQLAYVGFNAPAEGLLHNQISKALSAQRTLQLFSTLTSLPLKFLFIGLCYWHLQSGRLAFYMEKTRLLIEDVPDQWKEFVGRKSRSVEAETAR
jgi:hypothetical protein